MNTHRLWKRCLRTVLLAALLFGVGVAAAPVTGPDRPDFHLPFDGTLDAERTDGGPTAPTTERDIAFTPGLSGQAAVFGGTDAPTAKPLLEFAAGDLFKGRSGTLMFWVRPDWEGRIQDLRRFPWYHFVRADGADGKRRLWLFMWNWLRCDLPAAPVAEKKPRALSLAQHVRAAWFPGDWHHVAVSWNDDGWNKLYVDGLPYEQLQRKAQIEGRADLADVTHFYVGSVPGVSRGIRPVDGAMDEFKFFRRAVGDAAVMAEYRRFMPFDLVVDRRFLRASVPEKLVIEVFPGGGMTRPGVGTPVSTPVSGSVMLALTEATDGFAGQVLASRTFRLLLRGKRRLELPVPPLPAGEYRFVLRFKSGETTIQRTLPVIAFQQRPAPPATDTPADLGPPTADIDCTLSGNGFASNVPARIRQGAGALETYREAGEQKGDRFSFEVPFPQADGHPVALEIVWPDNRPRAMGLYMYVEAPKHAQHRDRLEGGIQSGNEFPVSGRMQTTRYLFYPWAEHYLFEARTLMTGAPAAVARIRVLPVLGRLPRLRIGGAAETARRDFGHLDEDQSFEILLGPEGREARRRTRAVDTLERLLDYLDYTGQNVISYPLLRYDFVYYDLPGQHPSASSLRAGGWISLFLDMFAARQKKLLATCNLYTVPEAVLDVEAVPQRLENGYFLTDRFGGHPTTLRGYRGNPTHPLFRRHLLGHVREILRRFGAHSAFKALDLWVGPGRPWGFGSLDYGYGDFTVRLFEEETGLRVPGKTGAPGRFEERWRHLTGPGRDAWLTWRAQKVLSLFRAVIADSAEFARGKPVYVSVQLNPGSSEPSWTDLLDDTSVDFARRLYEQCGMDMRALNRLTPIVLVPLREPSMYRWLRHWHDGGRNVAGETMADLAKFASFHNSRTNASSSYQRYFESFRPSLKNDRFKSYFQNADPKPFGRWFLQEIATAVAALDPDQLLIGAQPLGTAGRDDVTREFNRAWRALPQGVYGDVEGLGDPVLLRRLKRRDALWLYALSRTWLPVVLHLRVTPARPAWTDLSTGDELRPGRNGRVDIELAPFQLRSFRAPTTAAVSKAGVTVPGKLRKWYAGRIRTIGTRLAELREYGIDTAGEQKILDRMRRLEEAESFAELHRLLFSKRMARIPEQLDLAKKGWLAEQADMVRRSEYAVNCGSSRFRRLAGRLFFPDPRFVPGAAYGHIGSSKTVGRPVPIPLEGIRDQALRYLFAKEAYDVAGYRFKVKPGRYTVRLYLKVGYRPGAKPGNFVMSVTAEGRRLLDALDLFTAAGGKFDRAVVREFRGVEVRDGVLDILFSCPPGVDSTARLCNGIEVIPEHGGDAAGRAAPQG
ncbi:MAG: hypothetical protein GXP31_07615 [Kiritimatiellaeota bacterium]|nr:hypothetical protein [Kiritimatiellota bacterium]